MPTEESPAERRRRIAVARVIMAARKVAPYTVNLQEAVKQMDAAEAEVRAEKRAAKRAK
jgi:hypothetical protein